MKQELITLAKEAIEGRISGDFTSKDISESLREAFVAANGGSTKVNLKTFYRGSELFEIVEEILPYIIRNGLSGDEFFNELIEYRNMKEGDLNEFWTEDKSTFIVSNISTGSTGIRRQRLNAGEKLEITTMTKAIKVYEHLDRLMSKRVDFDTFVERLGKSYRDHILEDAYAVLEGISGSTQGLSDDYILVGTPSEDDISELIEKVEMNTGKRAKIIGTKSALKKIPQAVVSTSELAKADMYNMGYYGKFNGTDMMFIPQKKKSGVDKGVFSSKIVFVIASDDKPIKVVDEGEGLLRETEAQNNADLTQEYLYMQKTGTGIICNEKLGMIKFN